MNKLPYCRSEAHPDGASRDSMRVAEETSERVVFVCKLCCSIQVRTLKRGWQKARYTNEQKANQSLLERYKNRVGRVRVFMGGDK